MIDVRAIFQQSHRELDLTALPGLLPPRKGRFGLVDYEKAFCADPSDDIFEARAIARGRGCVVVVRPDQYVAHMLPLDATADLAAFFNRFLFAVSYERAAAG